MYNHPLIELLKTFSKKELMWFNKFLDSPYFNNRKTLIIIFNILKKFYPEFEGKTFTKENLYRKIYPNIKYNDSTFRNLMSDLLQLAQQFLKQEGIEKQEIESSFFLTKELFKRGSVDLFKKRMSANENILKEKNIFDSDYFKNMYRVETDKFYMNLLTKKISKKHLVIAESEQLLKGIVFILNYFVLESIKQNDVLLNYSRTYNIKKNLEAVSQFLDVFNFDKLALFIKNNSDLNLPIVEVYYNLLKAFTNFDDEKYYIEFKKSLSLCASHLGKNDNNFLYSRLIDYCITKKNRSAKCSFDINKEIFELHETVLNNGYYKTESSSHIAFDFYRNVLLNCITVKKLAFMEQFIEKYSKKLIPSQINNVENYSYALLYFEKGQFNKAISNLNKIKFDQFIYKLDMKNLQLKIYYEIGQYESAIFIIDTYKHFLKNNLLISEHRKILHRNFVNMTHKLIQYQTGSKQINLSYLADRVLKSTNIFDKNWISEKIHAINKGEQLKSA